MSRWVAASASVTGARHVLRSEPCEDRHGARTGPDFAMVALADGHGSERCSRAGEGAAAAVSAAMETLAGDTSDLDVLASAISDRWRATIAEDLAERPATDVERRLVGNAHEVLYGTTLLAARADDSQVVVIQIGDGDVVVAGRAGTVIERPLAEPGDWSGLETDSLSEPHAEQAMRSARFEVDGDDVELLLLASDGFGNAFERSDWHLETMQDLLTRVGSLTPDQLGASLGAWCSAPAEIGGDDVSIGLILRTHLLDVRGTNR